MKHLLSFSLVLGAIAPAQAAPRPQFGEMLFWYDRVPAKHFADFGRVGRRALLKRKGAVVDLKRKYIEIPFASVSGEGDLYSLQISVISTGRNSLPIIAVSRTVNFQPRRAGTIHTYDVNDGNRLFDSTARRFPYRLKKRKGSFENAYLPRKSSTIMIGLPQSEDTGPFFRLRDGQFAPVQPKIYPNLGDL